MHKRNIFCRAGMAESVGSPLADLASRPAAAGRSATVPALQIAWVLLFVCGSLFAAEPLRIFAAAGTAPAMKEIASKFTEETGIPVVFNFANAGTLARQITSGAPFDIFFSANEKWMNAVGSLIDESSRVDLLRGDLVLIVPSGKLPPEYRISNNEQKTVEVEDLQGSNFLVQYFAVPNARFAIGDQSTPLGIYAKEAFEKLGWWDPLQPCFCVGDTVNKVLNYVALGEADVGVVFRSVAFCASDRVDILAAIPSELHRPIRFPIAAAVNASPEAVRFLDAVQREDARSIFEKYGWRNHDQ